MIFYRYYSIFFLSIFFHTQNSNSQSIYQCVCTHIHSTAHVCLQGICKSIIPGTDFALLFFLSVLRLVGQQIQLTMWTCGAAANKRRLFLQIELHASIFQAVVVVFAACILIGVCKCAHSHTHTQTNWFLWSGPKNAVSLIKRHNNLRVRAIGASMIIDYVRWPVRQLIATSQLTMWCVNTRATNNVSLAAAHANCANNDNEKAL